MKLTTPSDGKVVMRLRRLDRYYRRVHSLSQLIAAYQGLNELGIVCIYLSEIIDIDYLDDVPLLTNLPIGSVSQTDVINIFRMFLYARCLIFLRPSKNSVF